MMIFNYLFGTPKPRTKSSVQNAAAYPCGLVIGNRGTGKSEGLKARFRRMARERKACLALYDLHGTTVRDTAGWMVVDGHQSRTFVDVAAMTDKALPWPFVRPPTGMGLDRQTEIERIGEEFLQAVWAKRGQKDGQQNPWIKQYAEAATRVFLTLPEQPPLHVMLKLFEPDSREHHWMLDTASDADAVRVFRMIEQSLPQNGGKNPNQYWMETRPAWRALRIIESPSVWLHHGMTDFWRQAIKNKWIVLFDLSGISTEAARFITIASYTAAVNAAREMFEEDQKPHPLHLVLEEAGANDTVTPFVIDSLQQDRKRGVSWEPMSQTSRDFHDQDLFEQLMSLTDEHRWYRVNSGADRAARDLVDPSFDALAVHYTRERNVTAGHEEVHTKSVRKGHDGEKQGHTEGVSFRPIQKTVTDEFYKSPQLQLQEWETRVSNLQVGQYFLRTKAGVTPEPLTDRLVGTAWPSSINKKRTERLIEEIRKRPQYLPPQVWSVPRGGAASRFGGS